MLEEKEARRVKRAVIKEEYIAITGDLTEAIILNQMIYWSERVSDFDKFIEEEKQRCEATGEAVDMNLPLLNGWIHKSAAEMKDEIMSMESVKTIGRKLNNLVKKGFLERRNNPQSLYDHKYQYRVNLIKIIDALYSKGYSLEGYRVDFSEQTGDKNDNSLSENMSENTEGQNVQSKGQNVQSKGQNVQSKGQNVQSKGQNVQSKGQNVQSKGQNVQSKGHSVQSKGHSVQTIPETIIETIIETTSIPSNSPYQDFDGENDKASKDKNETPAKLEKVIEAIGLNSIRHKKMIEPLKNIICGIVRKNGEDAISSLTSADIDGVIDRFAEQSCLGQIMSPEDYLKASLIKAGRAAKLRSLAITDSGREGQDTPSYDMDEFIRMSMEQLHAEN
ncbi:hypothetical protein CCDG5_0650 [[Clostridium] cellulosi]|uniref:DnaD domain-containing protein n=1 Tax=[Clostridium] cellulosi TaxID=29343 RepID=A0A078KRJ9_9FIRM|nr:hypothetical protein CCDG5_0650 [[Clostridium] cellulosi]